MQTITELLDVHKGEEAWIFGKGPSLDRFDFALAGALRICINESLAIVDSPTYFFAHDEGPIERVASNWPHRCRAILQPVRGDWAVRCGIPMSDVFTYEKRDRDVEVLDWPAAKIAQRARLIGLTGTVHSALHFCRLIGVSSVVFVGMDGRGGYARCVGLSAPVGGGRHDAIRRDSIMIAERLKLTYRFESEASDSR